MAPITRGRAENKNALAVDIMATYYQQRTNVPTLVEELVAIAKCMRDDFKGTIIINKGITKDIAEDILSKGYADLFAFGYPFIANPTLVEKLRTNEPFAEAQQEFLYSGGAQGYIAYV